MLALTLASFLVTRTSLLHLFFIKSLTFLMVSCHAQGVPEFPNLTLFPRRRPMRLSVRRRRSRRAIAAMRTSTSFPRRLQLRTHLFPALLDLKVDCTLIQLAFLLQPIPQLVQLHLNLPPSVMLEYLRVCTTASTATRRTAAAAGSSSPSISIRMAT